MPSAAIVRILAPLALLLVVLAVAVVLLGGGGSATVTPDPAAQEERADAAERRSYRVRPGDALSEIAARYDVPLEDLVDLNPDIDPQALQAGDRIRLRR